MWTRLMDLIVHARLDTQEYNVKEVIDCMTFHGTKSVALVLPYF